jgi:TonB family protein
MISRIFAAFCFACARKMRVSAVLHGVIALMVGFSSSAFGQGTPVVGSTLSQSTDLVKYVKPRCPSRTHVTKPTTVQLHVVINADGDVKTVEFVKGDSRFRREALRAVKLWKYKPATVRGTRVEIKSEIQLTFSCPLGLGSSPITKHPTDPPRTPIFRSAEDQLPCVSGHTLNRAL